MEAGYRAVGLFPGKPGRERARPADHVPRGHEERADAGRAGRDGVDGWYKTPSTCDGDRRTYSCCPRLATGVVGVGGVGDVLCVIVSRGGQRGSDLTLAVGRSSVALSVIGRVVLVLVRRIYIRLLISVALPRASGNLTVIRAHLSERHV